jgi:hypothetical protein
MTKKKLYKLIQIIQDLETTYQNDRAERGDKMKTLFSAANEILTDERDKMKPL